jgi:hypothetical protein
VFAENALHNYKVTNLDLKISLCGRSFVVDIFLENKQCIVIFLKRIDSVVGEESSSFR